MPYLHCVQGRPKCESDGRVCTEQHQRLDGPIVPEGGGTVGGSGRERGRWRAEWRCGLAIHDTLHEEPSVKVTVRSVAQAQRVHRHGTEVEVRTAPGSSLAPPGSDHPWRAAPHYSPIHSQPEPAAARIVDYPGHGAGQPVVARRAMAPPPVAKLKTTAGGHRARGRSEAEAVGTPKTPTPTPTRWPMRPPGGLSWRRKRGRRRRSGGRCQWQIR